MRRGHRKVYPVTRCVQRCSRLVTRWPFDCGSHFSADSIAMAPGNSLSLCYVQVKSSSRRLDELLLLGHQFRPCDTLALEIYQSERKGRRVTSRKPDTKFLGSLALSSSSILKYFIMCEFCFQKLSVSCDQGTPGSVVRCLFCLVSRSLPPEASCTHLKFGMTLCEQDIDCLNVVDISVLFILLPHLCPDSGNWHV